MEIGVLSPYCQPSDIFSCHGPNDSNRHLKTYLFLISPNIIFPSVPWSESGLVPSLHRPKPSGPVHFSSVTFCVIWFDPIACGGNIRRSSSGTFIQLHLSSCLLGPNTLLSTLVSLSSPQYEIPSSEVYVKSSQNFMFLPDLHHYIFRYLRERDRVMKPLQKLYIVYLSSINRSTL